MFKYYLYTFSEEDHARSGPSECFVCGGGDDVAVLEWTGCKTCSYESTDVSHVSQQVGSVLVRYLPEPLVVQMARVATDAW